MRINNFKELEREIVESRGNQILKVKNDLTSTRSLFQFIGDLLELFIPRMMDSIVVGKNNRRVDDSSSDTKYPHES